MYKKKQKTAAEIEQILRNTDFYTAFWKKYLHRGHFCDTIFQHSARRVDFLSVPGPQTAGLAGGMKPPEVQLNLIWRNKQLWQILASFP